MKPLKLTMQAFGPYAGTETIDFTALKNRTMFVISGKTGAGKTTIFDGISYAIYGRASGEDRNGPELRSQFAREELLTEVSLEFALRNKAYFITRSPQQDKKKERGDGFTTIGAKAELYELNEQGEKQLLASNVRDVDEKIKEIMLIDSNQFRQILMIPQGEFRKLLTSDSKDKEVILQRLFHTEIYKKIEDKLKEEAVDLKKTVEKQVGERNQAIQRIHPGENEELKGYLDAGSVNDTLILPLVHEVLTEMANKLEKLTEEKAKKQEERDLLKKQIFEAETILNQLKAREVLLAQKEKLEGQKDIFEKLEQSTVLARKALLLTEQEERCRQLKRDLDQSQFELKQIQSSIETLTSQVKESEQRLQFEKNKESERNEAAEKVNRLKNIKEDVYSFASIEQEAASLKKSLEETITQKQAAENELKIAEHTQKALIEEKEDIEKSQLLFLENERKLEKLDHELEKLSKLTQQLSRKQNLLAVFEQQKGLVAKEEARLEDAKTLLEVLEQKWLHSQAAVLAGKLTSGDSCPVCGSEHHPNLAVLNNEEIPSEEDLKVARKQVTELEKGKNVAEKSLVETNSSLESLNETIEEQTEAIMKLRADFKIEEMDIMSRTIESERDELAKLQKVLFEQKSKLVTIKAKLEQIELNRQNLYQQLQQLNEKQNTLTIQYTEKKTSYTRMITSIPEDVRSVKAFEAKLSEAVHTHETMLKRLEQAMENYQALKEKHGKEQARYETVQKHVSETESKLSVERDTFKKKLTEQGFENYSAYEESRKTEQEINQLDFQLRQYREDLRSVSDRFNELTELLKDVKPPDLEGLNKSFADLTEQMDKIEEHYKDLYVKQRENQQIVETIDRINEQLKILEDRYKLIGHLYDISRGQNTYRITFERFVLAAFLDDILREANVRLAKMTSGRYRLLRKTDRSKGNVQSGLELLVFDQYTGQERHVKTLSGGESFKAALSLALGLADVVQNYAGGVSLETMFIDEGFGTLDPESLDQAIEALIDIQSSGRLVGIISHVPELKERIDVRLEVVASQSGSRTEFLFMN